MNRVGSQRHRKKVTFYEEFPHQIYIIVPSSIRAISHVDGTVMFLNLTGAYHSKAAEYHDLRVP
jgi:hypothetical protein